MEEGRGVVILCNAGNDEHCLVCLQGVQGPATCPEKKINFFLDTENHIHRYEPVYASRIKYLRKIIFLNSHSYPEVCCDINL